jgi:flagellar basal body-associated protein FliL
MSNKAKIILPIVAVVLVAAAGVFFFTNKKANAPVVAPLAAENQNPIKAQTAQSANAAEDQSVVSTKDLPKATGNVDDTVNAIIDGATSEANQANSTDSAAQSAVGNTQDTNNLTNTYD